MGLIKQNKSKKNPRQFLNPIPKGSIRTKYLGCDFLVFSCLGGKSDFT